MIVRRYREKIENSELIFDDWMDVFGAIVGDIFPAGEEALRCYPF